MKFTLTITLGNEAMRAGFDVQAALREAGVAIGHLRGADDAKPGDAGRISDENGNAVGAWKVSK